MGGVLCQATMANRIIVIAEETIPLLPGQPIAKDWGARHGERLGSFMLTGMRGSTHIVPKLPLDDLGMTFVGLWLYSLLLLLTQPQASTLKALPRGIPSWIPICLLPRSPCTRGTKDRNHQT